FLWVRTEFGTPHDPRLRSRRTDPTGRAGDRAGSILHGGLNSIQIATSRLELTPDSARVVRPTRRGSSCWDLQGADDQQVVARANVAMPGSGREEEDVAAADLG